MAPAVAVPLGSINAGIAVSRRLPNPFEEFAALSRVSLVG